MSAPVLPPAVAPTATGPRHPTKAHWLEILAVIAAIVAILGVSTAVDRLYVEAASGGFTPREQPPSNVLNLFLSQDAGVPMNKPLGIISPGRRESTGVLPVTIFWSPVPVMHIPSYRFDAPPSHVVINSRLAGPSLIINPAILQMVSINWVCRARNHFLMYEWNVACGYQASGSGALHSDWTTTPLWAISLVIKLGAYTVTLPH